MPPKLHFIFRIKKSAVLFSQYQLLLRRLDYVRFNEMTVNMQVCFQNSSLDVLILASCFCVIFKHLKNYYQYLAFCFISYIQKLMLVLLTSAINILKGPINWLWYLGTLKPLNLKRLNALNLKNQNISFQVSHLKEMRKKSKNVVLKVKRLMKVKVKVKAKRNLPQKVFLFWLKVKLFFSIKFLNLFIIFPLVVIFEWWNTYFENLL